MHYAVVILAGGSGRRIGGEKASRLLGGRRLVDWSIDRARGFSDRIALSVGNADQLKDCGIPLLPDVDPNLGPLAGLMAGLDFAAEQGSELLLMLACDSPFLPDDLAARLLAALTPDVGAAVPRTEGRLHFACALWREALRSPLGDYVAAGGRSLQGFARSVGFAPVDWRSTPVDPFFNINNALDLDRAEAILAERT